MCFLKYNTERHFLKDATKFAKQEAVLSMKKSPHQADAVIKGLCQCFFFFFQRLIFKRLKCLTEKPSEMKREFYRTVPFKTYLNFPNPIKIENFNRLKKLIYRCTSFVA